MIAVSLSELNNKGTASGVHQWDLSQQIDLSGTDVTDCIVQWVYDTLPPGTTTDNRSFSLRSGDDDFADGGIVDIPDVALMQTGEITGYIYYNGTETIGSIVVNPIPREQPADYVSPDNTVTLQDLIETAVDEAIPTFVIGTVEAGEAPAAELVETETGYALDLTLQTGPTGPQGPTGPTGPQGPTGPTGPAGADGESIDVVEISEADYLAIETPDVRVLYVVDCPIHVVSVSLDYSSGKIGVGKTFQLTETILPINAADKTVSWSSSDTDVATVDEYGLVTGVGAGSCTITCTTTDGSKTATFAATAFTTPALWSGEKVYNGLTMRIETDENGDTYITVTGKPSANGPGYFTENVPLVFDFTGVAKWCDMAKGDELSLTTEKISGTGPSNSNTCFGLADPAKNVLLAGPTWASPTGTYTATLSAAKEVLGFRMYVATNYTFSAWKLKVTFSVNGQRWF